MFLGTDPTHTHKALEDATGGCCLWPPSPFTLSPMPPPSLFPECLMSPLRLIWIQVYPYSV